MIIIERFWQLVEVPEDCEKASYSGLQEEQEYGSRELQATNAANPSGSHLHTSEGQEDNLE